VSLLRVDNVVARHGLLQAVRGVSFEVEDGETIALVGANGAGKSTLLRTIAGAHPAAEGSINFDRVDITRTPAHQRVGRGLVLVPEGRRLFPELTVEENLLVAGRRARRPATAAGHPARRPATAAGHRAPPGPWTVDAVLDTFPMLRPLRHRRASTLSGGEQQATAIGRALMTNPRLLLVDEVSLGLAPVAVEAVYECLAKIEATLVLVEQDLRRALSVADRVVCLLEGRIVLEAPTGAVTREQVTEAYFGLSRT
jgi:branched-chain amino acid transport system ATP-binding protein